LVYIGKANLEIKNMGTVMDCHENLKWRRGIDGASPKSSPKERTLLFMLLIIWLSLPLG
jgi:hypothetical protein